MLRLFVAALLALAHGALAGYVNPAVLRERAIASGGSHPSVPQMNVPQAYAPHDASPEFAGVSMLDRGERLMRRVAGSTVGDGYNRPDSNYRLYRSPVPPAQPLDPYHVNVRSATPDLFQQASRLPPPPSDVPMEADEHFSFPLPPLLAEDVRFQQQYPPAPSFYQQDARAYQPAPQPQPYQAVYQQQPPAYQPLASAPAPVPFQQPQQFDETNAYPEFLATSSRVYAPSAPPVAEAVANAYSHERFQQGRADYSFPESHTILPLPMNNPGGPYRFRELSPAYPSPAAPPPLAAYPNMNLAHTPTYGMFPADPSRPSQSSIPPPPSMPDLPPPPVGIF